MKLNPALSTACWLALLCAPQIVLAANYGGISGSIGGIYESDRRSIAELLETVKNRRRASRADALRALQCRGALPPAAAPVFIAGLKDRDLEMRAASAELLGNVRPTTAEVS